jgi:hypothetical protein
MRVAITPSTVSGNCIVAISPALVGKQATAVLDADYAAVAQGVGEFLAEEGVAFRLALDEVRHRSRQRRHAEATAHERDRVVWGQALEPHPRRACVPQQGVRLGSRRRLDRPRREYQQQRLHPPAHCQRERPRRGVEPVGVFEDEHDGPLGRALAQEPDGEFAQGVRASLLGHLPHGLAFLQPDGQHERKQRRPGEPTRVVLQLIEDRRAALGLGEAAESEQLREHRAPGMVGAVLLDGVTGADERAIRRSPARETSSCTSRDLPMPGSPSRSTMPDRRGFDKRGQVLREPISLHHTSHQLDPRPRRPSSASMRQPAQAPAASA